MESITTALDIPGVSLQPSVAFVHTLPSTTAVSAIISPTFPFLDLAPELRQRVFECYFEAQRITIRCQDPSCSNGRCRNSDEDDDDYDYVTTRLAITRVSKLMRIESVHALLRVATFDFQLLDQHPTWMPGEVLRGFIGNMKHVFGPPRLMHHLGITTLPWCSNASENGRWVQGDCVAEHVVCDMIIDQFDIDDALVNRQSNEGQYFEGVKTAIAGSNGDRLTLCVQIEDAEPVYNVWDSSHTRSGIQVWKQKVIVRRKPRTEQGKVKLRNTLSLLGLELEEKDQKVIEPAKNDVEVDDGNVGTGSASNANAGDGVNTGVDAVDRDVDAAIANHSNTIDDFAQQWWNSPDDDGNPLDWE